MHNVNATQEFISFRLNGGDSVSHAHASGSAKQRRAAVRKWRASGFSVERRSLFRSGVKGGTSWVVTKTWTPKSGANLK